MKTRRLSKDQLELLRTVIGERQPELLTLVESLGIRPLTQNDRESLRSVLCDEFCENGLKEDSEPNLYGVELDDLIALLMHY